MSLSVPTIVPNRPVTVAEPLPQRSLRIKNILCPVNFSDSSLTAFKYGACLARWMRSRLLVQHTVQIPSTVVSESRGGTFENKPLNQPLDALKQQAGAQLRRMAAVARLQLPEVRLLVNEGDTHHRVLQSIEQNNIDLVVMGMSDIENSQHSDWNSLTEQIVRDSTCPVLVVCRPQKDFVNPDELRPAHLKSIVLATDFSSHSDFAVIEALNWAAFWSAKLIMFHAVHKELNCNESGSPIQSNFDVSLESQLLRAWDRSQAHTPAAASPKIAIHREVRTGDARKLVLELAEENKADLIVMGSRGSGLTDKPWGSTITAVVRNGLFPVLAVPSSMVHSKQSRTCESCYSQ